MLGPLRFKRGKVPGPGALEFAFQRWTYDPVVSPIGSGVGVMPVMLTEPAPVTVVNANAMYAMGIGVETGQTLLQPLLTPSGF